MNEINSQIVDETALVVGQWFVYLYRDPRPTRLGEPLYVGMGRVRRDGQAKRMRYHWTVLGKHKNRFFGRTMLKLKRLGLSPIMELESVFATDREAKAREIELILIYGKRLDRTGTLFNITSGGDGTLGLTIERGLSFKERISAIVKKRWADPAYKARVAQSVRDYFADHPEAAVARGVKIAEAWTDEKRSTHAARTTERLSSDAVRSKISAGVVANTEALAAAGERIKRHSTDPELLARRAAAIRQAYQDPVLREKLSTLGKSFWNSPQGKALKSEMSSAMWENPESRSKITASVLARWQDPEFVAKATESMRAAQANLSPETKARMAQNSSQNAKRRWSNPEWKARTVAAMKGSRRTSDKPETMSLSERWKDPLYRAKIMAARAATAATPEEFARKSAASTAMWSDPAKRNEIASKISAAKSTPSARKRTAAVAKAYYADPKRRAEAGDLASAYNTPEIRAAKAAALKARWADPEFRARMAAARAKANPPE